jgi:hypothetical protein
MHGVSGISTLCDNGEDHRKSKEGEEIAICEPKPVQSFTEVKSFFLHTGLASMTYKTS